jgi:stage V sporulation protein R
MGFSRIFEVVFPGNPARAYLSNTNSIQENLLVLAHVLGHADFAKTNSLFQRAQQQLGGSIVTQAATHARRIALAIEEHGQKRVEDVLDAALALEPHIDDQQDLSRSRYSELPGKTDTVDRGIFQQRFDGLPGETEIPTPSSTHKRIPVPPRPEYDLLWFIAHYAPDMEDWERDIFLAVREESFYFHPIFRCNIMNEGWASYWHARLLREADFLPGQWYIEALKVHSDVVRPYAGAGEVSLAMNPYHLGFVLWEKIIQEHGMAAARQILRDEDDVAFVHNHLDDRFARDLGLFVYHARRNGEVGVAEWNIEDLHEAILHGRYNYGAPRVFVREALRDGSLLLGHAHQTDGRGLDIEHARRVLAYLHRVWRRPVRIETIDSAGNSITIEHHDNNAA